MYLHEKSKQPCAYPSVESSHELEAVAEADTGGEPGGPGSSVHLV